MASASRQEVLQSTQQWLQPLIHVLLVCGITWREFSDLAKTSYRSAPLIFSAGGDRVQVCALPGFAARYLTRIPGTQYPG